VVLVDDPDADIIPYLNSADILVTDASSTMFDYLAVDRPILLLRNPNHTRDTEAYDPQGIEWRWREIGREIMNPADLPKAVDLALKTPDAGTEVRERFAAALFDDTRDGGVGDRIIDLISELST
jgi:CDP-glycerol glycerophosphotransferase (TagB/SpsB family)